MATVKAGNRLDAAIDRILARVEAGGLLLWAVVSGGIWLWAFHLLFLLIFTREACYNHAFIWAMHACTAVTGLGTMACGWVSLEMIRRYDDSEDAGTIGGRTRFLGLMGLLTNVISLALILLEGAFAALLHPCG